MSLMSAKKMLLGAGGGVRIDDVFNVDVQTSGSPGREISGLTFAPHFNWQKALQNDGSSHQLYDTERGRGRALNTAGTGPEQTQGIAPQAGVDGVSKSYVSGVAAPSVAFNFKRAPRFFDVVSWTGNGAPTRRITHGLRQKPGMIIMRRIADNASSNWFVYHSSTGGGSYGLLNRGDIGFENGNIWGTTEPTTVDFVVSDSNNGGGSRYIAYVFANDSSPRGIIKCSTYVGNGSDDGPIVNVGWEPQWLLIRKMQHDPSASNSNWLMFDTKRFTSNPRGSNMAADVATPTGYGLPINITATGFKILTSYSMANTAGYTYLYMAIRKGKA